MSGLLNLKILNIPMKTDEEREQEDRYFSIQEKIFSFYSLNVLRDFKPQLTKNLVAVYGYTYNDPYVQSMLNNKKYDIKHIYKDKLINFISKCYYKRITDLCQRVPKGHTHNIPITLYHEFDRVLKNIKKFQNDSINSFRGFDINDLLLEINSLRLSFSEYFNNFKFYYPLIKNETNFTSKCKTISQSQCDEFLNSIVKISTLISNEKSTIDFNQSSQVLYSLLYIYTILRIDECCKYDLKLVYDLVVSDIDSFNCYSSNNLENALAKNDKESWQNVDLTTSICMFPEGVYYLPETEKVQDSRVPILLGLQEAMYENFRLFGGEVVENITSNSGY